MKKSSISRFRKISMLLGGVISSIGSVSLGAKYCEGKFTSVTVGGLVQRHTAFIMCSNYINEADVLFSCSCPITTPTPTSPTGNFASICTVKSKFGGFGSTSTISGPHGLTNIQILQTDSCKLVSS
jgi:hypothetical protein